MYLGSVHAFFPRMGVAELWLGEHVIVDGGYEKVRPICPDH